MDILQILLDWNVIIIIVILLIVLPIVFYMASLNKSPITIKKIKIKNAKDNEEDNKKENEQENVNKLARDKK